MDFVSQAVSPNHTNELNNADFLLELLRCKVVLDRYPLGVAFYSLVPLFVLIVSFVTSSGVSSGGCRSFFWLRGWG